MRKGEVKSIVWADTRGGRNDTDPPLSLRPDQCVEMLNVDWKDTQFARKRGGATALSTSGGSAFSQGILAMVRFLPTGNESGAQLWAVDGAGLTKRLAAGTTWVDFTLQDVVATTDGALNLTAVSLNGKLFIAYDSGVDRLHCLDPDTTVFPYVRRASFATPAAPTVADDAVVGTYANTLRYYRVRWLQLVSSRVIRRSEPGASQSFTPNGGFTAAVVTRPAAASEQETHWEIEASADNVTFYRLSQVAIATTTYSDTALVATYPTNTLSDPAGTYGRFPSVKHLLTDGNRVLGAGAWESSGADSGGLSSRVWFTPVLGSTDQGDDERIPNTSTQKNWVDLNEKDGGGITGLGGPINGLVIAFKYRQIHKLRPTGDVGAPYLPRRIRDDVGSVNHKSIAIGEDQIGRPALYFYSHRGPYRVTFDGDVEYLGRDNEVTWRSVNLGATLMPAHSVYYPDLHQWWLWIATGSANLPDVKMVFDVQKGFPDEHGQIRGGWVKHTGNSAAAYCSCLFSNTPGAGMSLDLKPHIGRSDSTIWKCDTADLDDATTDFQAYVKSKPMLTPSDLGRKLGMAEPVMLAKASPGVTLTLTTDRDFGLETRTHTAVLTASASETRVVKKFEGGEVGEADVIQAQIGDGSAQEGAWSIDQVVIPTLPQEPK